MRNGDSQQVLEAADLYGDDYAVYAYRTDEHDIDGKAVDREGMAVVAIYVTHGGGQVGAIMSPSQARALASGLYTAAADSETETA